MRPFRFIPFLAVALAICATGAFTTIARAGGNGSSASAQQTQTVAAKRQQESLFLSGALAPEGPSLGVIVPAASGGPSPDVLCGQCGGGGSLPPSAYFTGNQQSQQTSYWCGPAAVSEALGNMGVSLSQSAAASALGTTTDGTGWSNSGGPVPTVLNGHQSRNPYVSQPVSSASSSAINQYEEDLMSDAGVGAPVVGDGVEVAGGPHLNGHPTYDQIYHWFDIRGYTTEGEYTMYEDSVHGATSISWSSGVPAYSTMLSSTIVTILAGDNTGDYRGYVW